MPVEYGRAERIELSETENTFWKQIIPLDKTIVYNGNTIKFGRDMLNQIVTSFDKQVLDQTAFQLANDSNQHDTPGVPLSQHFDPRRYSGDVTKLVVNDRGLFGKFKLTKDGAELIKKNPRLGVSASLKPNYIDSDGNSHQIVMRHVLGTLDPKIKGMSPWSKDEITLSNDDETEEVIDLAAADTETPPTDDKSGGDNGNTITVDKSDYENMKAQIDELSKGEDLLNEILAETEDDDKVSLSNEAPTVDPMVAELRSKVAKSEWKAERGDFTRIGVPASMLNLAEEIMESPDDVTINLSNGESADPKETIRKILMEAQGTVDLSAESGHGMSDDERSVNEKKQDDFVNDFMTDLF